MPNSIEEKVKTKLESSDVPFFPAAFVEVIDNTAGHQCDNGAKLEVVIVSDKFEKVPLLHRQRMVNDALADLMPSIHALSMKTWTVQQYEAKRQQAK